jgi:hypothetical protein
VATLAAGGGRGIVTAGVCVLCPIKFLSLAPQGRAPVHAATACAVVTVVPGCFTPTVHRTRAREVNSIESGMPMVSLCFECVDVARVESKLAGYGAGVMAVNAVNSNSNWSGVSPSTPLSGGGHCGGVAVRLLFTTSRKMSAGTVLGDYVKSEGSLDRAFRSHVSQRSRYAVRLSGAAPLRCRDMS